MEVVGYRTRQTLESDCLALSLHHLLCGPSVTNTWKVL